MSFAGVAAANAGAAAGFGLLRTLACAAMAVSGTVALRFADEDGISATDALTDGATGAGSAGSARSAAGAAAIGAGSEGAAGGAGGAGTTTNDSTGCAGAGIDGGANTGGGGAEAG
ncbi:hypothetical protein ABQ179_006460 [Xanthomonas dyei]|uniref:hypothetical protein n=1 Tax=Xanthomonas dyei TaxID=743699 RepID=UPI0035578D1D